MEQDSSSRRAGDDVFARHGSATKASNNSKMVSGPSKLDSHDSVVAAPISRSDPVQPLSQRPGPDIPNPRVFRWQKDFTKLETTGKSHKVTSYVRRQNPSVGPYNLSEIDMQNGSNESGGESCKAMIAKQWETTVATSKQNNIVPDPPKATRFFYFGTVDKLPPGEKRTSYDVAKGYKYTVIDTGDEVEALMRSGEIPLENWGRARYSEYCKTVKLHRKGVARAKNQSKHMPKASILKENEGPKEMSASTAKVNETTTRGFVSAVDHFEEHLNDSEYIKGQGIVPVRRVQHEADNANDPGRPKAYSPGTYAKERDRQYVLKEVLLKEGSNAPIKVLAHEARKDLLLHANGKSARQFLVMNGHLKLSEIPYQDLTWIVFHRTFKFLCLQFKKATAPASILLLLEGLELKVQQDLQAICYSITKGREPLQKTDQREEDFFDRERHRIMTRLTLDADPATSSPRSKSGNSTKTKKSPAKKSPARKSLSERKQLGRQGGKTREISNERSENDMLQPNASSVSVNHARSQAATAPERLEITSEGTRAVDPLAKAAKQRVANVFSLLPETPRKAQTGPAPGFKLPILRNTANLQKTPSDTSLGEVITSIHKRVLDNAPQSESKRRTSTSVVPSQRDTTSLTKDSDLAGDVFPQKSMPVHRDMPELSDVTEPELYYRIKSSLGERQPVIVGQLVIRLRDREAAKGKKCDRYDIFDGPFEVSQIDMPKKGLHLSSKEVLSTKVQLKFPQDSQGQNWVKIEQLLPVFDAQGIGSAVELHPVCRMVSELPEYRRLLGKHILRSEDVVQTPSTGEENQLYAVELQRGVFVIMTEVLPRGLQDNDVYEVEKLRGKRLRLVNDTSRTIRERGLKQDVDDPWVKLLQRQNPELLEQRVVFAEYLVKWAGWPSEDDSWTAGSGNIPQVFIDDFHSVTDKYKAVPAGEKIPLEAIIEGRDLSKARKLLKEHKSRIKAEQKLEIEDTAYLNMVEEDDDDDF